MTNLSHSPLTTVSVEDIFNSVPTDLTDAELTGLITEIRARRSAHLADEAAKQAKGKKASTPKPPAQSAASAAKSDVPPSQLTLDDLLN